MIRAALVTAGFFVLLQVLGVGHYVSALSGTLEGGRFGLFLGLLYAATWFTVVTLVPVLLIAGLARQAIAARVSAGRR